MRRFASLCGTGALAAVLSVAAIGRAQDAANVVPSARTDPYTVFTDGFYNPQSIANCGPMGPDGSVQGEINSLLRGPRHYRWIFSNDTLYWNRAASANKVLVTTSPNLFDDLQSESDGGTVLPSQGGQISATPGIALFPATTDQYGLFTRLGNPNDVAYRIGVNAGEVIVPNQVRMETNDFEWSQKFGQRPTIGIELESGSRILFSYFWVNDFRARALIDDVSNAAFLTLVPYTVPTFAFQRMGYLNSPFQTTREALWGEIRMQLGPDPSTIPHNPANENPSVPAGQSRSVPREPTVTDPSGTGVTTDPTDPLRFDPNGRPLSFLFQDGELAIANYAFNIQGGELAYFRKMNQFRQRNYDWDLVFGVRYIGTDEMFNFFFADTTYDRAAANPGSANIPGLNAPNTLFPSQPATQTQVLITNTIRNDMVGPEIGANFRFPVFAYFEFDVLTKFAGLANWMQKEQNLIRGDGFLVDRYVKDSWATTGAFEGHLGLNFRPHANVTLRAGWEWLYLVSVATAPGNIAFDLDQQRRPNNNSDALFHGWYGGIEIVF